MKKSIWVILIFALVLSLFTSCDKIKYDGTFLEESQFIKSESNDDYEYDVYEDYTIITAYIGEDFRVSIPKKLGGKKVKGLGKEAIGSSMLAVEIVDIPKDLVYIEPSAFKGCTTLTAFTVAEGNPVYKSDKGIMYMKDGKTLIHYPAGKDGDEFTVSSDVEKIGDYAFTDCEKLVRLNVPSSVTAVGTHCFDGCTKLASVSLSDNIGEIPDSCFYECSALAKVNFPKSLVKIGKDAFYYCISLPSAEIPDNVSEIGDEAFYKCETLQKAVLPKSLKTYGYKVFSGCKLLTAIDLSPENQFFKSVEGEIYSADGTTFVEHPYGKYIRKVNIINGVTSIRAYAFYRDYQGRSEDQADNIETIDFNNVEKIGAYAFANRKMIREVNLPSTLKEISSTAFYYCENLEKYSIKDCAAYTVDSGVLYTNDKKTLTAYPASRKETSYKIAEGTENIGAYAFSYAKTLIDISLPDSLVTVGDYAFYMAGSVTGKIAFGKNLKSLGKYCFSHCAGIENLTIPDNTITEIPQGAFECFDGAFEFVIPEGVTKVGEDAFRETAYIVFIKIPSTVTEICDRAFYDMDDLHKLTIPESVETFGKEIVSIFDESNPDKVTLKVYSGSAGEQYAKDNNIPYETL